MVPIDVHGFQPPTFPGEDGEVAGAVPVVPFLGAGDIHLFPAFFKASELARGAIVLHQATHKYVGTEDHAYLHEARYAKLSVADALNNADSYAMLCAEDHGAEQDREGEERETERIAKEKADFEARHGAHWGNLGALRAGGPHAVEGRLHPRRRHGPLGLCRDPRDARLV